MRTLSISMMVICISIATTAKAAEKEFVYVEGSGQSLAKSTSVEGASIKDLTKEQEQLARVVAELKIEIRRHQVAIANIRRNAITADVLSNLKSKLLDSAARYRIGSGVKFDEVIHRDLIEKLKQLKASLAEKQERLGSIDEQLPKKLLAVSNINETVQNSTRAITSGEAAAVSEAKIGKVVGSFVADLRTAVVNVFKSAR